MTSEATRLPRRTRVYQNHHLDSTRWDRFRPRDDDIVISTSYKAGTTWMQTIVANLVFPDGPSGPLGEMSPWLGMRVRPLEAILALIEAQTHRRFLKSHLALDGLPYFPQVKYIYVGRDPRDVFMSLWNHYRNYTPFILTALNNPVGLVGDPLPPCPEKIRDLWRVWTTRGWFPWENDGYPMWSHLHHARTWWAHRELPNLLLVHFNDLLNDLEGGMRRVAKFLEIEIAEERWPAIVDAATFATMRKNAAQIVPEAHLAWKGGAQQFIYKGTNGRWRDVLDEEDLTLHRESLDRSLPPDCAKWLIEGGALP